MHRGAVLPVTRGRGYTVATPMERIPLRLFLLGLLFIAFVVTGTALTVILLVPELPLLLGVPAGEPVAGWQALATLGMAIPLVFATLYLAGLLWLFCACHLFHRREVERLTEAGPSTRLETWLLERFAR